MGKTSFKLNAPIQRQRGVFLLVLVVIMASIVGSIALANLNAAQFGVAARERLTATRLEKIRQAVISFVAANGKVPCGVSGAAIDSGDGDFPSSPYVCTATSANGVVPWKTLSLPQVDSLDGWGRKISYRIYDGTTGLTAANFADMTNCDTSGTFVPLTADSLCPDGIAHNADHGSATAFLSLRTGLTVIENGVTISQVGLVLISHGVTGKGAYLGNTARMPLPADSNFREMGNTASTGPFYITSSSDNDISDAAATHFDDRVSYMTVRDLIAAAGRGPRDWQ